MKIYQWMLLGVLLMAIPLLSGCSEDVIVLPSVTSQTTNGTVYDPSRTFELVSYCASASFDMNPNPNLLNCSLGNITDVSFNTVTHNWSCMSCSFDSSKCSSSLVSNITLYNGLNLTAEHIISSGFDGVFTVMCCNAQGSQCYRPLLLASNGTYQSCGAGYNELIGSITFNNVSNNWSVLSCLNGFK